MNNTNYNNDSKTFASFTNEEWNIILGALNCYIKMENLPDDLKNKSEDLRKFIRQIATKKNF